jgi:hypothetical protein
MVLSKEKTIAYLKTVSKPVPEVDVLFLFIGVVNKDVVLVTHLVRVDQPQDLLVGD